MVFNNLWYAALASLIGFAAAIPVHPESAGSELVSSMQDIPVPEGVAEPANLWTPVALDETFRPVSPIMTLDNGPWATPGHVLAAAIGLSVLDITTVTLRFIARKKQKQALKADDWLIIPGTLFTLGIGIAMVYGVATTGLAYPMVNPDNLPFGTFKTKQISIEGAIQYAYMVLMPLALGCTKASFLFFYHRIFAVHRRGWNNIVLVGLIILAIMWMVAFTLTFIFQCRLNMWAYWSSLPDILENCLNDGPINIAFTVTDFIGDLIVFVIPIPMIWRLNLSWANKLSITAVFLFGAVTVAVSLARLILTVRIYYEAFNLVADPILTVTAFIYWGMIECGMAVFTASLPTFSFMLKSRSWKKFVAVARSIAESGTSGIRLLRSKTSRDRLSDGRAASSGSSIKSGAPAISPELDRPTDIMYRQESVEKGYGLPRTNTAP